MVKLSNYNFRFEKVNGVQIIQAAIHQGFNDCSFASVSTQLDYQLRLLYSKLWTPIEFPRDICLFDHDKWQKDLKLKFPNKSRWHPAELLEQAKTVGAPLWNGQYHVIQEHICVHLINETEKRDVIRSLLDFSPIVGVFEVRDDYRVDGDLIYHGTGAHVDDFYFDDFGNQVKNRTSHAVVLLDYLEVDDMLYIIYQNSDGDHQKSLCGRGVSLVKSELLVELFYGASLPPVHPPAVLQSFDLQNDIVEVVEALKLTDEYIPIDLTLRAKVETYLGNGEWEDVEKKLKEIDTLIIQRLNGSYSCLIHFVRKFGDVEKAMSVSVLEVAELLKSSKSFLNFYDSMFEFTTEKSKLLKTNKM